MRNPGMSKSNETSTIDAELDAFKEKYKLLSEGFRSLKSSQRWHTPNNICFSFESMTIREFQAPSGNSATPVLIVYSHVNLPYVIDLTEEHSLVCRLIEAGLGVYLLDWGEVNGDARTRDLSVYVHDYLDKSIDFIFKKTGVDRVNLIGVCQGGTFALCYASIHPEKVRRLVTAVTPVDFHAGESVLFKWARKIDFPKLEETPVNIPGEWITLFFQSLRPYDDMMRSIRLIQGQESLESLNLAALIDQWVFECPDQPGKAFAQFMRWFFQENQLIRGELELNGHRIDLGNIRCPVLNLYASADHLVPKESTCALMRHVPDEHYSEMPYDGGHIGLLVGATAHQTILPLMAAWLAN